MTPSSSPISFCSSSVAPTRSVKFCGESHIRKSEQTILRSPRPRARIRSEDAEGSCISVRIVCWNDSKGDGINIENARALTSYNISNDSACYCHMLCSIYSKMTHICATPRIFSTDAFSSSICTCTYMYGECILASTPVLHLYPAYPWFHLCQCSILLFDVDGPSLYFIRSSFLD